MTVDEMRKFVWNEALKVTIDMQYSKSKYLQGKHDALKIMWEKLGGDKPDQEEAKCELCCGNGGWYDGSGPLAEPVPCPECGPKAIETTQ